MADKRKICVIPKAPVGRIILRVGAKRVSQDAVDTFDDILTKKALELSAKAARLAKHAGRRTVHEEDIKLSAMQHK